MHYFVRDRALYVTNWRAAPAKGHPGTLMRRRAVEVRYPETGPQSQLGEDLAVALQIQQQHRFQTLTGAPYLYVYVNHGANSWSDAHHRMLTDRLGLSKGLLRRQESELRAGLAPFDFGQQDVTIKGPDEDAFILSARRNV